MKTNDNENNGITRESIKDLIENANLGGSDSNDPEKKARIDLLKESIIAAMVDSNINKDEEDEEEPETEDNDEHLLDDDEISEMIEASINDSNNEESETYDDMDDDDLDKALGYQGFIVSMDASDYHNQTCVLARANHIERAVAVAVEGLKRFKYNPTLMADVIKYCTEAGDRNRAARYYSMLKEKVDVRCWDWRAFTYSFDYLLASGPVKNEKEMRTLLKSFKKSFPYLEKPYFKLAELEEELGNRNKCMKVLEDAIKALPNACQCALKLADYQLERNLLESLINTCDYGTAVAIPQPTINTRYLVFLRTLARDCLLRKKVSEGLEISEAELRSVREDYERLLSSKSRKSLRPYIDTIEERLDLLSYINTNF